MYIRQLKYKVKVVGVLATTTALAMSVLGVTQHAGADPLASSAKVAVGSDTIQDLFNAYSGAEPAPPTTSGVLTQYYTPMHSTNGTTVSSFDAIPVGGNAAAPGCIISKFGGNSFDRPNGSSNGIQAIRQAVQNLPFSNSAGSACPGANVAGQVDFARSSRGPNAGTSPCTTAPNCLDWVPIGRDAVDFIYFDHGSLVPATLKRSDLISLFSNTTTGTITIGTETIKACLTQSGSGTTKFFEGALGVADATAVAAATASGCYTSSGQAVGLEENGGDAFFTFANALPANTGAVIDFSAGSWISQANQVAVDRSSAARAGGADLGDLINDTTPPGADLGKAYTGTAPAEAPNTTFYGDTTFGRDVYVVVPAAKFGFPGDAVLKNLFSGGAAAVVCNTANQAIALKFGFSTSVQACGTPITANLLGS